MNPITMTLGALLNTLWQSAALAAVVWIALRLAGPRVNAATRHVVWWIALAAVVALPLMPRRAKPAPIVETRQAAVRQTLPAKVPHPLAAPVEPGAVMVTESREPRWPWIALALWTFIAVWRAARMARSYMQLRGLKRRAREWAQPVMAARRAARVMASDEISSPVAVGFAQPAVIVPEQLRRELSAEELDCVLLHETAHLERYDDWENLAAWAAKAAIGLHPVCWWLLRQIDREREIACDEWVVARTGAARAYARSLARVIELRIAPVDSALAAGIFGRPSRLRTRIALLLEKGRLFSGAVTRRTAWAAACLMLALAAAGALAPRWIVFAQRKQFEVASVKPNVTNGSVDITPKRTGGRIAMHNVRIDHLIFYAFHLRGMYQVDRKEQGQVTGDWFDIDARAPEGASDDDIRLMMQTLLEERFGLKTHRETRQVDEYRLVKGKGEPKLKASTDTEPFTTTIEQRPFRQRAGSCSTSLWVEGAHTICHTATLDEITRAIENVMRLPVVNQTGIAGTYSFNLLHLGPKGKTQEDAPPLPTIEEAVEKGLGLKLEKSKGLVEVLVVDHYERPTAN